MTDHQSTAEGILAQATAIHAADGALAGQPAAATAPAPAQSIAQETAEAPDAEDAEPGVEAAAKSGLSWEQAMKQVPPSVAKLMKNMQADYTRKTQEVASQRKELLRERDALLKGTAKIPDTTAELPEYDPFDESTIAARIEREVAKRLREALEPMQQEYEVMAAEDAYQTFQAAHPDFTTDMGLRSEVQKMLETNPALDLETASWAAKGKQSKLQAAKQEATTVARRKAEREAALTGTGAPRRGGGTVTGGKPDLKKMSAADIYRMAQAMHK